MLYKESSGKKLYLILWGGAALIGAVMTVVGYLQQTDDKKLLRNPAFINPTSSDETINDLLLSANELTIAEKKSFISLYHRQGDDTEIPIYQKAKDKRYEIYKQIFQRKMNKLNGNSSADFSVKPVPK